MLCDFDKASKVEVLPSCKQGATQYAAARKLVQAGKGRTAN